MYRLAKTNGASEETPGVVNYAVCRIIGKVSYNECRVNLLMRHQTD